MGRAARIPRSRDRGDEGRNAPDHRLHLRAGRPGGDRHRQRAPACHERLRDRRDAGTHRARQRRGADVRARPEQQRQAKHHALPRRDDAVRIDGALALGAASVADDRRTVRYLHLHVRLQRRWPADRHQARRHHPGTGDALAERVHRAGRQQRQSRVEDDDARRRLGYDDDLRVWRRQPVAECGRRALRGLVRVRRRGARNKDGRCGPHVRRGWPPADGQRCEPAVHVLRRRGDDDPHAHQRWRADDADRDVIGRIADPRRRRQARRATRDPSRRREGCARRHRRSRPLGVRRRDRQRHVDVEGQRCSDQGAPLFA